MFWVTAGAWKHAIYCKAFFFRKVGVFPNIGEKQKHWEWVNLPQFTSDPLRVGLNVIAIKTYLVYYHVN